MCTCDGKGVVYEAAGLGMYTIQPCSCQPTGREKYEETMRIFRERFNAALAALEMEQYEEVRKYG